MNGWDELVAAASNVRENAYAPYSGYRVGAALRDEQGRVWTGVNVENLSYGGTICAERSAVVAMVSGGGRRWTALAVSTDDGAPPCGLCLQVLHEFAGHGADTPVMTFGTDSAPVESKFSDFLPRGFASAAVKRTER